MSAWRWLVELSLAQRASTLLVLNLSLELDLFCVCKSGDKLLSPGICCKGYMVGPNYCCEAIEIFVKVLQYLSASLEVFLTALRCK